MSSDDERLEMFLRQFRPRRPRPLPWAGAPRRALWAGAIAAGLLIVAVAALILRHVESPADVANVESREDIRPARGARASHVVNWDVDALDRMLTEMSPRVLPDVERRDGSLHVLAGE